MAGEPRRGPQSVTRVIRLIEALCASAVPMSLAELARAIDAPKSTTVGLLRALDDEGFVIRADNGWRLGGSAFGLGGALNEARRRVHSSDLLREGLHRLAERSGETVLFAVADDDALSMTYVEVVESRNVLRYSVAVGDRRMLNDTAGGRALLSAWGEERLGRWIERFPDGDRDALLAAVRKARATGHAQTRNQAAEGVTGTAALVREASGGVLGALIVAAPTARLAGRFDEVARLVREEAAAISASLGFRPL